MVQVIRQGQQPVRQQRQQGAPATGQQVGGFTARPQQQVMSMQRTPQAGHDDLIQQLTGQMQQQQTAQRSAAEQQHQSLMEMFAGTQEQVMGMHDQAQQEIGQVGEQARERARQDALRRQAQLQQQMVSAGMGGTTVPGAMQRGIARDTAQQQAGIDEQQAQLRAGALQQQAGAAQQLGQFGAQAITAAQHEPPQMQAFLQLIQQLAQQGAR